MSRPDLLTPAELSTWLAAHPGWSLEREAGAHQAITREFKFANFSAALGFVVQVGIAAEKHDHHPDIQLSWGKACVLWSTHDSGGVTTLDLKLAEICEILHR
jgi:4a-hydroxytetrahydrobiopterin dehydratase